MQIAMILLSASGNYRNYLPKRDLTVPSVSFANHTTQAKSYQKYTQAHVSAHKQSNQSTQYSVNFTADGGLEMNLKKLKTPSILLKKLAVGVTFAAHTATSGAA
ncbi:hypothetical protein [Janthinobacterium agaricidamnosum]|nr:hypothetical protein [Janthinobacterium agaricidamnosum]